MKRLIAVVFALLIGWCSSAIADGSAAYGTFKILGIGGQRTDSFVVVFASYVSDGYQQSNCAKTDWWWPAGTTHTWWVDRNDMITFAILLSAARNKTNVFLSGFVDPKVFGTADGARCRFDQFATR